MTNTVKNEYGVGINYEVAVNLMDEEIREELHGEMAPCTEQEFFDRYTAEHEKKFSETWELAKVNPCY